MVSGKKLAYLYIWDAGQVEYSPGRRLCGILPLSWLGRLAPPYGPSGLSPITTDPRPRRGFEQVTISFFPVAPGLFGSETSLSLRMIAIAKGAVR